MELPMVDPRDILLLQIISAPLYAFLVPLGNSSALDCITLESHMNSAYLMVFSSHTESYLQQWRGKTRHRGVVLVCET